MDREEMRIKHGPFRDRRRHVHFRVVSNGFTREQWISHFRGRLSRGAYKILRQAEEPPTKKVIYNIGVLAFKYRYSGISAEMVQEVAKEKKWLHCHWEVACLIRDALSNEELKDLRMGWSLMFVNNGLTDIFCDPHLLLYIDFNANESKIDACKQHHDQYWCTTIGFPFVVPEKELAKIDYRVAV
ncbi:MAG: hypothetical protein AAB933_03560 [Patescibacteria group bacterium]